MNVMSSSRKRRLESDDGLPQAKRPVVVASKRPTRKRAREPAYLLAGKEPEELSSKRAATIKSSIPYTKSDWAQLGSQREKEAAWLRKFSYNFDPSIPEPVTTPEQAISVYAPKLAVKAYKAISRRAYLAALKGGVCEIDKLLQLRPTLVLPERAGCQESIADYRFLRLWEFNHIRDRGTHRTHDDSSSGRKQFVICGNDIANRQWPTVLDHCMKDTVLLCRECHAQVTEFDKIASNEFAAITQRLLQHEPSGEELDLADYIARQ